jgi:hypothetical protein
LPLELSLGNTKDRWTLRRVRNSNWLSLDNEQGSGSDIVTVSIDRSKIPAALVSDTLEFRSLRPSSTTQADSSVKIPVSVDNTTVQIKAQNVQDVLQQQISSLLGGVQMARVDTTLSLLGTFAVTSVSGSTTYSSLAAFTVGQSVFTSIGRSIALKATASRQVSLQQRGLSYTSSRTGTTVSGFVYAPSTLVLLPQQITFDGTTQHSFTVPASSTFAGFTDAVQSVLPPTFNSAPSTIAKSQNLTLNWTPTSAADDSVFVVLVMTQDSTARVVPSSANDNVGTLTIPSSLLNNALGSRTGAATLWIVRYRYTATRAAGTPSRGLLCQAQRGYGVTITP